MRRIERYCLNLIVRNANLHPPRRCVARHGGRHGGSRRILGSSEGCDLSLCLRGRHSFSGLGMGRTGRCVGFDFVDRFQDSGPCPHQPFAFSLSHSFDAHYVMLTDTMCQTQHSRAPSASCPVLIPFFRCHPPHTRAGFQGSERGEVRCQDVGITRDSEENGARKAEIVDDERICRANQA